MSQQPLNLKIYLLKLFEDSAAWNHFSSSTDAAKKVLAEFKIGLTDDQAQALIFALWQIRQKFSEAHYELVNTVAEGNILLYADTTFGEHSRLGGSGPPAGSGSPGAGAPGGVTTGGMKGGPIGDGPKQQDVVKFDFRLQVPAYCMNAVTNALHGGY